jgi:MFS family permease
VNTFARRIQHTYLILILGNTLAASFIWGINTLFLLDAGLSNLEAFAANAFFTAGMVVFEVPTGVIADTWGRRASFLMGTVTLALTTLAYYLLWQSHAPFWQWAIVSALLGLGFTFFSGATEAWLVDALKFAKYEGSLESIFSKAQIVGGVAMLGGSVAGGVIAQVSSLGVPFLVRAGVLLGMFVVAWLLMKDYGFEPETKTRSTVAMKRILTASIDHGFRNPPVRWLMLAAPFTAGVGFYAFYALQPYLLELYGNQSAYSIAGLTAAIVAGSQIAGGVFAPRIRRLFKKRTSALIFTITLSCAMLLLLGLTSSFIVALGLIVIWGLMFSASVPIRQAYLNDLIPSKQRATVLSFDSLVGNTGGVVFQPALGRAADVWSYSSSYIISAGIQILSLPFLFKSRASRDKADVITNK